MEPMREAKTIAVVGVSAKPDRPSHDVAAYLIEQGYTVYLVNPTETEVLGRTVYPSVQDLPEPVDIVDISAAPSRFRRWSKMRSPRTQRSCGCSSTSSTRRPHSVRGTPVSRW